MSQVYKCFIIIISVLCLPHLVSGQDCETLYPDYLTLDYELIPPGPYEQGEAFEMLISVSNFVDVLAFTTEFRWDPTQLCLNTDTLTIDNPQKVASFPNELATSADINSELERVANSGKLAINFNDNFMFTGVTVPDGEPMLRVAFIACGVLDCNTFEASTDFENENVARITAGGELCLQDSIVFNVDPLVDEACIECAEIPAMIDQVFCAQSDGSLNVAFSVCGDNPPFMYTVTGPTTATGTIAQAGDVANLTLDAGFYLIEIVDALGNPAPGNSPLGFGYQIITDEFEPIELTLDSDPSCASLT